MANKFYAIQVFLKEKLNEEDENGVLLLTNDELNEDVSYVYSNFVNTGCLQFSLKNGITLLFPAANVKYIRLLNEEHITKEG